TDRGDGVPSRCSSPSCSLGSRLQRAQLSPSEPNNATICDWYTPSPGADRLAPHSPTIMGMPQPRAAARSTSRYAAWLADVPVYGSPRSVEVYCELTLSPFAL